jgi:hypothetical protein
MGKFLHYFIRKLDIRLTVLLLILAIGTAGLISISLASSNSSFGQTINAGTLSTDIQDATRITVPSPSISMSAKSVSFDCYEGATASTGTFGSNAQRIYVSNPNAANNGWTLTMAAQSGATATWANGGATQKFDFNDAGGSPVGCGDGADADSLSGQMTIDPSVGTLTADCANCTTGNISKGSSAAFVEGTTNSITLLNAAAASNDIGRWYLTGVSVSQTIPAEQTADSYTINMSLTVAAT